MYKRIIVIVFVLWAAIAAVSVGFSANAKADGTLTTYEMSIVQERPDATCGVFDAMFDGNPADDMATTMGVTSGMMDHYPLSADNAMDVINEQVYEYCYRHWDNLVAVGEYARSLSRLSGNGAYSV